jgi:hypothetical protein
MTTVQKRRKRSTTADAPNRADGNLLEGTGEVSILPLRAAFPEELVCLNVKPDIHLRTPPPHKGPLLTPGDAPRRAFLFAWSWPSPPLEAQDHKLLADPSKIAWRRRCHNCALRLRRGCKQRSARGPLTAPASAVVLYAANIGATGTTSLVGQSEVNGNAVVVPGLTGTLGLTYTGVTNGVLCDSSQACYAPRTAECRVMTTATAGKRFPLPTRRTGGRCDGLAVLWFWRHRRQQPGSFQVRSQRRRAWSIHPVAQAVREIWPVHGLLRKGQMLR